LDLIVDKYMDTQFDDEVIDYIDPDYYYMCSPQSRARRFTLLMKYCLLYHRDPTIIDRITDYVQQYPDSLNEKNSKGWTPLIISARNSQTYSSDVIVSLLIDLGADINAQCEQGETALITACQNSGYGSASSTVKILFERGADPNIVSSIGTVFHVVCCNYRYNYATILDLLLKTNIKDKVNNTPLHKANANIKDQYGNTPLHNVDRNYPIYVYQLLIDNGVDVNSQNCNGNTPLMIYFVYGEDLNIISLFLDAGTDILLKNHDGYTVLDLCNDTIRDFIMNYEPLPTIKEPEF
jgi:ankyrin repeat protein